MAKNSIDAYGAAGKTNVLLFDPDTLTLVTDEASPLYDERVHLPVDEALARNIDYQGVLEPVAISKNPETGNTEVVFGRQRVKAARLANQWRRERGVEPLRIQGVVYQGKRQNALDAIASENEARTADSPLGRAEKMRRHLAMGRDEEQLAVIYACSIQTVRNTLALLDCTQAVQQAVEAGQIGVTQAKALGALPPEDQREKVQQLIEAGQGVKPHERARRQRAVLGDAKPKMKGRKEIMQALETAEGPYAEALRWVLGAE
ncbi:MAG: ParB/RepB/Spo0J family partition protein [Corticimicrobacter sp.]|uniref:ParB/RepB/Spo0J family partition protein n=1 Tax=Corticimicrobacter sp. TaxID=2678536 RepID=UPI0032DB6755